MLTSYLVHCPHLGCDWQGSLLPQGDLSAWRGSRPTANVVNFQCPQCGGDWQAKVVGDDVVTLPLPEMAMPWA